MTFQAPNYAIVNETGFSHFVQDNRDNSVEEEDMSSHNYSLIQGRVSGFFNFCLEDFTAPTELSLDMTALDRQTLLKNMKFRQLFRTAVN
jgi:hypothetical protein